MKIANVCELICLFQTSDTPPGSSARVHSAPPASSDRKKEQPPRPRSPSLPPVAPAATPEADAGLDSDETSLEEMLARVKSREV